MEVVKLEGMNRELSPPAGWDKEKHGECSPLPVFAEVVAGNVTMTSAWKPNAEELAHLVRGAAVALVVYGTVHPPVAIGVFPAEQEVLDGAVEKLRAVLCGPEGQVDINGSDEDKAIVARALAQLELEAQNREQKETMTVKVDASDTSARMKSIFGMVKFMLADLLVKLTPPTGEELIDIAPGEYSDWEKRIWRRGYQAAVTAMREAVASADSGQG